MSKYLILDDLKVPENMLENWQITVDLLAEIGKVPAALIMRVHAVEVEVFVSSRSSGNRYHVGEMAPLDTGLYCETVMSTRRKLLVPNALKDLAWDHNPDIKRGMISYCGLPITWPNGELFGTICVLDSQENPYSKQFQDLLERFRDSIKLSLAIIYEASFATIQKCEVEDITQRKSSEAELEHYRYHLEELLSRRTNELEEAKQAAEDVIQAKSGFLADLSHDLRTPLNAILGLSDLLCRDPATSETQQKILSIIHKSGDRMLDLINNILDIAKIEAGRMTLELAPFDLGGMILDITNMLCLRARDKGLQLLLDESPEFPHLIVGDQAKLRQILINLITNAIKATEQGSVTLRLRVKSNHTEHLLIEVEDTGCGIASDDQAKLMQPYVQVGSPSNQRGNGHGLTITRQFVELMGGSLSLTSAVGQGSTFRVNLPVQLARTEDVSFHPGIRGEVTGLAPGQLPCRLLVVVDDQEDNRLLLTWLLEKTGFQVNLAENGAEAVEQFTIWMPDFILMDQRMPVMDGVEAVRRIRILPGGDRVKIVVMTASTLKEEDEDMVSAGFDEIVHKPFCAEQIFACMERLLGLRFVRDATAEAAPAARLELCAAAMAAVPQVLCAELHEAMIVGESEGILNAIDAIGQTAPELAEALHEQVQNYNYEAILVLLEDEPSMRVHGTAENWLANSSEQSKGITE